MRPFAIALVAWTAVVLAVLLFYPAGREVLGCMHLVGRSLACETQQVAINGVWWTHETLPMLVAFAAGYLGIVGLRLACLRRSRA